MSEVVGNVVISVVKKMVEQGRQNAGRGRGRGQHRGWDVRWWEEWDVSGGCTPPFVTKVLSTLMIIYILKTKLIISHDHF
jgi:hypothetical protein